MSRVFKCWEFKFCLFLLALANILFGCAHTPVFSPSQGSVLQTESTLDFERMPLEWYMAHSVGLKIPLPNRHIWQIEPSIAQERWVAYHSQSDTKFMVFRFEEMTLTSRHECLTRAKKMEIFPKRVDSETNLILRNEQLAHTNHFEKQYFVMVDTQSMTGHAFLIMSHQRMCWVAHLQTTAKYDVLAERLEFFSSQILEKIQVLKINPPHANLWKQKP